MRNPNTLRCLLIAAKIEYDPEGDDDDSGRLETSVGVVNLTDPRDLKTVAAIFAADNQWHDDAGVEIVNWAKEAKPGDRLEGEHCYLIREPNRTTHMAEFRAVPIEKTMYSIFRPNKKGK